jgi:geranylgeranylglycerol-phosphate geranylgeranyltransferase
MIRKLKSIWALTRLEHGLMYGVGVLIGIIVAGGRLFELATINEHSVLIPAHGTTFGFLTALFIQAGTFALNDYCDLESDIANRRQDRPLVRGDLSRREALIVAILATFFGILCASFLHPILFVLAVSSAVLGVLYDFKIKEYLGVSNIYIALTMAIPFIFGGLLVDPGRINQELLILAVIAFLAGFGREVMKDIADLKGDALRNVRSIARVYGVNRANNVVIAFYSLAVLLSAIPFFTVSTSYYLNPVYALPVLIADALFLHTALKLRTTAQPEYIRLRKVTLLAIGFGLIGFISGALY